VQNIELHNWVRSIQYATNHQHKYFPSILGHLKIPKVTNEWNQMVVVEHINSPQYWVQQQEWLFMDKKNSHS
jgi:hypothetical protein